MSAVPSKEPHWPPKSPHEALLSSPSGRKKLQSRRDRDSPSPSPIRRPSSVRRPESRTRVSSSEDEDEETLELQLQAIEARLKLKKLQQAKAKKLADQDSDNGSARTSSRASAVASFRKVDLPHSQPTVQVPVSPIRDRRMVQAPKSPARVILGIDKGLRAQDVSLKRAPSSHGRSQSISGALSTSNSQQSSRIGQITETGISAPRGKTFSERIAESRLGDREQQEKESRIQKARSRGFGFAANALESSQDGVSSRAASSLSSPFSLTEKSETTAMLRPTKKATPFSLHESRSLANLEAANASTSSSTLSARSEASHATSKSSRSTESSTNDFQSCKSTDSAVLAETKSKNDEVSSEPTTIFEPFSGFHLSKRLIPHNTLTRTLDSKEIFTIPKLFKTVKSPNYDAPDVENDYVVLGIIASKSSPLTPKNVRRVNSTGDPDDNSKGPDKFMVLKLTDLKWEVNLYLFDTGFSTFWKLPVGTVIAILNPDILPPQNRDSGQFSLKLTSSEDTVLEIGGARDLGFCKAVKRDGKECGQWIDSRKTEYCDFHVSLQVEKSKRGRMEVNTMTGFGKDPAGRGRGGNHGMFGGRGGRGRGVGTSKNDGTSGVGRYHDKYLHETVYIAPGTRSAAELLDNDDAYERGFSRAELHRKRLAEKEKERELAKRLGEVGKGIGSEYMKLKGAGMPNLFASGEAKREGATSIEKEKENGMDRTVLGLLGRKAGDVTLSPVKRKRGAGGKATASEPIGWSGAFKKGLPSPKKQEQRETSPVKKRARFMLAEKGIREPGRDSLGGLDVGLLAAMDEDDDDGLDII